MIDGTRTVSSQTTSTAIVANANQREFNATIVVEAATGSDLTFSVEFTLDNVMDSTITPTWVPLTDLTAVAVTGGSPQYSQKGLFHPVRALRLNVTAYTDGSATLRYLQSST